MYPDSIDALCCPSCRSGLQLTIDEEADREVVAGSLRCTACECHYPIKGGLPHLVFPQILEGSDHSSQAFYDSRPGYDYRLTAFRFGIWSITFSSQAELMKQWPIRLELKKGDAVLETGIGHGDSLPYLGAAVGPKGRLHGLDISSPTLAIAKSRAKTRGIRAELLQGNASYLPYRDGSFDGVLHMGGFNEFEDKKRAVDEMHRVAKPGGKVVLMDEGLAPGRERTLLGKHILKCMSLFASKPPVDLLPDGITDLKVYWIYQGTFWVVEYRKNS